MYAFQEGVSQGGGYLPQSTRTPPFGRDPWTPLDPSPAPFATGSSMWWKCHLCRISWLKKTNPVCLTPSCQNHTQCHICTTEYDPYEHSWPLSKPQPLQKVGQSQQQHAPTAMETSSLNESRLPMTHLILAYRL